MVATIVTFCGVTWSHYHTLAEEGISLPKFEHTNNKQFLHNVKQCVHHVYYHNDIEKVNLEVLLAQAALESGWGNSRFAREGKNLFGIRTYDLREPHMLPSNKPKKWGVKVYKHECDSVLNYINILNNGKGFSEYRKLREKGITDPFRFTETLDAYATDKNYFAKIKSILIKIRKNY
tara:strand:+ start:80 stop:610 length:531 start_codon:yes stop_codon:yes gene_type:complete